MDRYWPYIWNCNYCGQEHMIKVHWNQTDAKGYVYERHCQNCRKHIKLSVNRPIDAAEPNGEAVVS